MLGSFLFPLLFLGGFNRGGFGRGYGGYGGYGCGCTPQYNRCCNPCSCCDDHHHKHHKHHKHEECCCQCYPISPCHQPYNRGCSFFDWFCC
ncbi:hypothetical protein GOM49_01485 [Clostridium bovifaecis]|uniref:Uncharacterized protein n=1 Tax=Clostridium bovifaecis TaxID=2184719 RepID=A0A6I6EPG9_9CLOT|nr:hypothetical protein GOM49_01485 [Clostridium bovifaecis]